jgi:hypothetical protein
MGNCNIIDGWVLDMRSDLYYDNAMVLNIYLFCDLLPNKQTKITTMESKAIDIVFSMCTPKDQRFETFRTGN